MSDIHTVHDTIWISQFSDWRPYDVYLPSDYKTNKKKRYPVLYLHDGQNLDDPGGPFGHWQVRNTMLQLQQQGRTCPIIVGIWHGKDKRIKEYTPKMPWTRKKVGGFEHLQFMAKTLKTHIDQSYRTKPDRIHTGIGGSSMGALVSLYASMMYPEIYSKYMLFSPSLWLRPSFKSNDLLYLKLSQARLYLYAGTQESKTLVKNMIKLKKTIQYGKKSQDIDIRLSIKSSAGHQEMHWAQELNRAISWLFNK